LKYLRKINDGEPYSLLQCKRPFTLAVKQFNTQFQTFDTSVGKGEKGLLERIGMVRIRAGKQGEDMTAHSAHELAKQLRNYNLDAYVLHCRYCSYVTVGAYDGLEDPRLRSMQNEMERFFKNAPFNDPQLGMMPRPAPMPVPGIGLVAKQ
jgi:hypothetical protein